MDQRPSTSSQSSDSLSKCADPSANLLTLPSFMLTKEEIEQQIELLMPNVKAYEYQLGLINKKLLEHKDALTKCNYIKDLDYFRAEAQEEDDDDDDEIITITTLDYPIISRYFKHWIGRETSVSTNLLKKLEKCLSSIEEAIDSNQLCRDSIQRKGCYVRLGVLLVKIHDSIKFKHKKASRSGSLRRRSSSLSRDSNCSHINECECNSKGQTQLALDNRADIMDDMVTLGSILLQMCYPPDAIQQSDEHISNIRSKILTNQPIESDEYIASDIYLITLLLGCSKSFSFGTIYAISELREMRRGYAQLTDKGKEAPVAVARIYEISYTRLLRSCGPSIKKVTIQPEPENNEIMLIV